MKYDRKKAKEKLRERAKVKFDRSSGGSKVIKSGIPQWTCKEGKHKIDIIPFVAGKKHPELEPGDPDYNLELLIHFSVGANDEAFICPRIYNEDCPICGYKKELEVAGELDDDKKKELRPKKYVLYNIVCYDNDEEKKKGVQTWLVSNFFMQEKLKAIQQDESGEIINFFETDSTEGKKIMFERKGSGAGNTSFIGHKFVNRDYEISNKLLEQAFSLDEVVIIPTYEEIKKAFFGKKHDEESEEDVGEEIAKEVNEDEDELTKEKIEEMKRKDLKQLIEDKELSVDPDEYDTKEELVEAIVGELFGGTDDVFSEETLSGMKRTELKELIKSEEWDIDPDDYDTKSELVAAIVELLEGGSSESKDPVCPNKKGTFGESFDDFDNCSDCKYFDECSDKNDELEAEKKKNKKKKK